MAIDWTTIIVTLIGVITSGGVGSLVALRYAKNKAKTEANSAANQEQAERIDLGDKYVNQMLTMLEKLQNAQDVNNTERKESWDSVDKKMNEIHEYLVSVKDEISSIVLYLNGGYKKYKDEHPELIRLNLADEIHNE
jgi:gas vesicle protein